MNDDHDLRARFQHQRGCEHGRAPVWNPRWVRPTLPQRADVPPAWRWAFVAVLFACGAIGLLREPRQDLAALPPWFESAPGELFAGLDSPSTDFLLPPHLNISMP